MKCSLNRPGDQEAGRKAQLCPPQRLGRRVFIDEGNSVLQYVLNAETKWSTIVPKSPDIIRDFEKYLSSPGMESSC